MGIKRVVDTSFWTDGKVDEFTPEDKYFMLYLLTNPFTTQLGIYEMSVKQAASHMGYSIDAINALIERFANKYGVIVYSKPADSAYTIEIAIKNFLRHSIIKGGAPVRDCLIKEIRKVKNKDLILAVFTHIKGSEDLNETVKNVISEYEEKNGIIYYSNEKQNDDENENENDVSYHESYDDSFNKKEKTTPQQIVDLYNSICISFPSVRTLSDARKKTIKARLKTFTLDDFKELFEKAESSSFLKGDNSRKWKATFDWLIKDANMAKVLDGNYNDQQDSNSSFDLNDFFNAALNRSYGGRAELERGAAERMEQKETKTVADDPEFMDRLNKLKKELQG